MTCFATAVSSLSFSGCQALAGPHWDVEFFHGHSQISESLYREIKSTCSSDELLGIMMPLSSPCEQLISEKMTHEVSLPRSSHGL